MDLTTEKIRILSDLSAIGRWVTIQFVGNDVGRLGPSGSLVSFATLVGLDRTGLVELDRTGRDATVRITDAGRAELGFRPAETTTPAHFPHRGDAVERWLVTTLDKYPGTTAADILTLYRMHSDAGTALGGGA